MEGVCSGEVWLLFEVVVEFGGVKSRLRIIMGGAPPS